MTVHRWVRRGVVLGLCGLIHPLHAQDLGFSKEFKVRAAYTPSPKDHLRSAFTGFGINLGYGLDIGKLGVELGYFYQTGDNYFGLADASKIPTGKLPMNATKSMEDKRNQLSGFTVRTTFSRKLNPTWSWQAGLQFGTKFKHQYVGDTQSQPWGASSGDAAWRDFYLGAPEEGGLNPSPFGGFTWKADKDSSVEFNVIFVNYSALEYRHFAGTGSSYQTGEPGRRTTGPYPMDSLEKTRRLMPYLEVAYVFHF